MEEEDVSEDERSLPDGSFDGRNTKQVDLFSEIHLNQMKRLEKQLESVESEKIVLSKSLKEIQDQLEKGKSAIGFVQSALVGIGSQVNALDSLKTQTCERVSKKSDPSVSTGNKMA